MEPWHLYDTDEACVGDPVFFYPFGNVDVTGFGQAEGTVTGDRVSRTIQWANQYECVHERGPA